MSDARAFSWRAELGRKGVHLASAAFPLAWAFAVVDRRGIILVLALKLSIAVALKILRRRSAIGRWFDAWFG